MRKIHFKEIDSTNTYLKNHYGEYDDFTFVSADYQTSGRGRTGRAWDSTLGKNLMFSFLIKREELTREFKSISIVCAYCVIQVLKEYGIDNLSIKWPNDVYVGDKKICGILLEGVVQSKFECLVVGIGLNVNQDIFDGEYLRKPTSLKLELNRDIDLEELKDRLFKQLEENISGLENGDSFYEAIEELNYLKDKEVYALINREKKKIRVLQINRDYSLKIEHDGICEDIDSGEISFHL